MDEFTADHFRRAAEDVLRYAGKGAALDPGGHGDEAHPDRAAALGVVAAVSPWNFPVDIAGIPIVYGLAIGCTTVWKPSEFAPLCAEAFLELLHDAGFPDGTSTSCTGAATSVARCRPP